MNNGVNKMDSSDKANVYFGLIFSIAILIPLIFGMYIYHTHTLEYIKAGYTQTFDPVLRTSIWVKE